MPTQALSFIEASLSTLEHSVREREGDLRNIQLATVSPGGQPGLRTLVLRGFERSPACAEMHTDARAGKVRDIAHASQVTFLAWSAADHLQLRFEGVAVMHRGDELARARWDKLPPGARKPYGLRAASGARITNPAEQLHLPPAEQFQQFTVILVSLSSVDVLRLEPEGGQTRACGRFTPSSIEAGWISA